MCAFLALTLIEIPELFIGQNHLLSPVISLVMSGVKTDPEDPDAFLITSPPWHFPEFEDLMASADYGEKKHHQNENRSKRPTSTAALPSGASQLTSY